MKNKLSLHPYAARTGRFHSNSLSTVQPDRTTYILKLLIFPPSFKSALLKLTRPKDTCAYDFHNALGVVLLTRLNVVFSHLREHKLSHKFADINDIETTEHYLLHCPNFFLYRNVLFYNLHRNKLTLLPHNSCHLTKILLYSDKNLALIYISRHLE